MCVRVCKRSLTLLRRSVISRSGQPPEFRIPHVVVVSSGSLTPGKSSSPACVTGLLCEPVLHCPCFGAWPARYHPCSELCSWSGSTLHMHLVMQLHPAFALSQVAP